MLDSDIVLIVVYELFMKGKKQDKRLLTSLWNFYTKGIVDCPNEKLEMLIVVVVCHVKFRGAALLAKPCTYVLIIASAHAQAQTVCIFQLISL